MFNVRRVNVSLLLKPTRHRIAPFTRRRTDAATARTDRATHRNRHFRTMFTAFTALSIAPPASLNAATTTTGARDRSTFLGARVCTQTPATVTLARDRRAVVVEARFAGRGGRGRGGGGRGRGGGGRGRGGRGRGRGRPTMDRGPMRNEDIEFDELRVLDENKEMLGVMSTDEALERAEEAGLDLVVMSPDADPPLARIMDYSKYKYEKEKKDREARKKAAAVRVDIKELKMRYNIDTHDYGVRLRAAQKFLSGGDKVKVICQFRGRENDFRELGREMFDRFVEDVGDLATVENRPNMEGNSMTMLLAPVGDKSTTNTTQN